MGTGGAAEDTGGQLGAPALAGPDLPEELGVEDPLRGALSKARVRTQGCGRAATGNQGPLEKRHPPEKPREPPRPLGTSLGGSELCPPEGGLCRAAFTTLPLGHGRPSPAPAAPRVCLF